MQRRGSVDGKNSASDNINVKIRKTKIKWNRLMRAGNWKLWAGHWRDCPFCLKQPQCFSHIYKTIYAIKLLLGSRCSTGLNSKDFFPNWFSILIFTGLKNMYLFYVFICHNNIVVCNIFIHTHTYIYIYTYIYTAAQKFGISKFLTFFKGVSSAHQGCIYSIKNTGKKSNIVKSYCNF